MLVPEAESDSVAVVAVVAHAWCGFGIRDACATAVWSERIKVSQSALFQFALCDVFDMPVEGASFLRELEHICEFA